MHSRCAVERIHALHCMACCLAYKPIADNSQPCSRSISRCKRDVIESIAPTSSGENRISWVQYRKLLRGPPEKSHPGVSDSRGSHLARIEDEPLPIRASCPVSDSCPVRGKTGNPSSAVCTHPACPTPETSQFEFEATSHRETFASLLALPGFPVIATAESISCFPRALHSRKRPSK